MSASDATTRPPFAPPLRIHAALLAAYGNRIADVESSRMKVNNCTSERL
jgi:hypothetical protein